MSQNPNNGPATTAPGQTGGGNNDASTPGWKLTLAGIVTVVSLAAFFLLIIYLLPRTDLAEPGWTRSVYLLSGVEAITFAAVGWLFGREVHRERAESAEKRAGAAEEQKDQAQRNLTEAEKDASAERAKGGTMAVAVHSVVNANAAAEEVLQAKDPDAPPLPHAGLASVAPAAGVRALADMAARLYPEFVEGGARPNGQ